MAYGNFAQTQLLKYGWTEGKGLGKNENGLTEALKPTLKFDKAGIGFNETNSEQWWETLYDKAVKNIKVDVCNNKVCLSTINDLNMSDDWNIVSSNKSKMKQLKYGNFLKSSTLHNGHLISVQDISMEKEEKKTAKNSVYSPTTNKLDKIHDTRTMATHAITSLGYSKCIETFEQQKPKLFVDVITNSQSQSDESLVKENIMIHRETKIELDTEESEDPDNNQEIITGQNISQYENLIFKSKKKRKNDRRRLNQLTQQFSICSLKKNYTDSKYISPHNKKLTRFKEEKDCKSQLNVKSGKCSKRKKKNRQKKRFEENIPYVTHETASDYDIPNELKTKIKNPYFIKSKKLNINPVISYSNSSKNKTNKDIYETIITLPIDEDRRNMHVKEEIEEKATTWKYCRTSKEEDLLLLKKYLNSAENILHKSFNKKIKKNKHEQKRVKKQIDNYYNKKKNCTDDLNSVIKKLTAFDLTEALSANGLKKKPTQTHLTPV